MPAIIGDKPIYRIKFSDADIREVRKGNELEWGLYKITYNKGINESHVENITEYVWGYPGNEEDEFNVTLNLPDDEDVEYGGITAAKMAIYSQHGFKSNENYSYRTHAEGWCSDPECLNYFPAVTRDMHTDLLLYCKWVQRQFLYKGILKNDRYVWDDGSGGSGEGDKYPIAPERHTSPSALNGDYYNLNSTAAVLGQCTWYAQGRTAEMRGTTRSDSNFAGAPYGPSSKSFGNAYDWRTDHGGHWSYTNNWSNVKVGDVVIFGNGTSAGHVAVVEWKSGNEATLSAFNNPTAGYDATSLGLLPWTAYENFVGPSYKWGDKDGKWAGFLINHIDPVLEGSGGGGEAGWVPDPNEPVQTYVISNNGDYIICSPNQVAAGSIANGWNSGTQDFPLVPSRYNQAQEDSVPGDHWRKDQRWEPLEVLTRERKLTYTLDDNNNLILKASSWTSYPCVTLEGTYLPDYNTQNYGPLDGWYMSWYE